MLPPVGTNLKDWAQVISWLVTSFGVAIALFKYVSDQRQARDQRKRQLEQDKRQLEQDASSLRWKQAEAAKKLLDEMLADEYASDAMSMMDWDGLEFEIAPGKKETICRDDYVAALRIRDLRFTEKPAYIRHCFDALFYYWRLFEHYINADLIRFEDISFPNDYYLPKVNQDRRVFDEFLAYYQLTGAAQFLRRLDRMSQRAIHETRPAPPQPAVVAPPNPMRDGPAATSNASRSAARS